MTEQITGQLKMDLEADLTAIRNSARSSVSSLKNARDRLAAEANRAQIALDRLAVAEVITATPPPPPDEPPPPPPPPPPATGWPGPGNTGVPAGTTLTPSGPVTVTQAGAVIEGKDISGTLTVQATGVIIRKCRVRVSHPAYMVSLRNDTVMEDCEVDGLGGGGNGIQGGTVRRCNIHGCENGWTPGRLLEDSWIHDLRGSADAHYDGIQEDGYGGGWTARHNVIDLGSLGQTSAVMIDCWAGSVKGAVVDNNILRGGAFTVYSDGNFTGGTIQGVQFTNNKLKAGQFGYKLIRNNAGPVVWEGNVDEVTGQPIP